MPKFPSPPVIEGTLKEPIYSFSFGMLVSMWSMNIGSLLTPHYFAYIVSTVFVFECILWFLDKPKQDYEVYKPLTAESKRQETPISTPTGSATSGEENKRSSKSLDDGTKIKKTVFRTQGEASEGKPQKSGKESRFRFRHKKNNADQSPQSPVQ